MDSNLLRAVGGAFVSGVTVITTQSNAGAIYGMTANSFTSLSFDPPLVLFAVNKSATIFEFLDLGANFGISILAAQQKAISQHFAGQGALNLEHVFQFIHDVPVIKGALAWYMTEIVELIPAGTHNIVICKVLDLFRNKGLQPLVYFSGQYRKLSQVKLI